MHIFGKNGATPEKDSGVALQESIIQLLKDLGGKCTVCKKLISSASSFSIRGRKLYHGECIGKDEEEKSEP